MRIDYICLREELLDPGAYTVTREEIMGRGAERKGFLGSDHCPLLLELRDAEHVESYGVAAFNGKSET
jgi:exonuclease III